MTYRWNYLTLTDDQKNKRNELAEELQLDPVLAELLIHRGISTKDEANKFLHPSLDDLHDPFLMPDMELAIRRIEKAIGNKERILIYGDYDVDGTTAVSLVYKFFRKITSNLDYYIPDRYDEGYGISIQGIDYAANTDVKLIISLDCGIKAISKIAYAKEKGIDFIVCDHHMPDDTLPDAVAVVDAKRLDSIYPYNELSGCGVGFKLVQAFAQRNGYPFSELESLLDLCAVSIAADIVPITGENRILMYHGLIQLNTNPCFGLRGIIEICRLTHKPITVNDIVFKIGPRINASGRMMNGKEAVDLLLSVDMPTARILSKSIDKYNEDRRELDKKTTEEAINFIDTQTDVSSQKSIVVYNENWHKGIVGIVASRLTERYYRPAVVLTRSSKNLISGSARSVLGFDVYKAIESCKDILENFGGHTYAAGLTLKEENLSEFKRRFNAISFDEIESKMMLPQIIIDAEIPFSTITNRFMQQLNLFSPFGAENENPVFLTRNVTDTGGSRLVGMNNRHTKLEVTDRTVSIPFSGIAFSTDGYYDELKSRIPLDICYTLEENNRSIKRNVQLIVKDMRLS
ncbi:MAG: single-stranded-DNA-specific exonuclease RecJ [Petrimonas sp.]|jgi:single-stranded-DNA-specific exonuclease|nr:single-stranded-DNA-specific exonuclease RecJ [Dysgonamonadaceae bacterium]MDD3308685.1 single-stranded-DNA-specific exonuclease RecJ [Dysgonamonadaceae bacterium]MDD4399633.1 single-stranded-DNA-specific exonuclease RecJ [Dysgonamonadaceae bacterium]MEA4994921.1 single-stranded-DNA-specific exonuclease RecJ [Petrimonas sp.]MEA5080265.1 single-stranded-DNA-specific exonuclease RecJ [Dysgonamonadaceae bacterium]